MTITVTKNKHKVYNVLPKDMLDGHAYEDEYGSIYICNKDEDCIAFSVCGCIIVTRNNPNYYREVNLKIEVC